ncbi:fimbria/pilus outer membrane usher protein [Alkalilacustris brevis]|uniref:fimbria/pilus outer membrane usher protein n=1 Tax=Alkalilacustris brevis TaxID=2026338 RepID=UPI000E0CD23C|nr:fimbria/pilus outer membrane usher protein [Alkalilacustris brevis]
MPRLQRDNRPGLALSVIGLCLLVLTAISEVRAEEADAEPGQTLHLEVFINGWPTGFITRFVDPGGGGLLADADELCRTGIRPIIDGRRGSGDIRLDRIDGVTFDLDQAAQTLHFTAAMESCSPRVIAATPQPRDLLPDEVDSGFGFVLNYNLDTELTRSSGFSHSLAGDFDARMFTPLGTLNHGFALSYQQGGRALYRRLNSYWRTPIPGRTTQVQFGDIASRGPSWSRPVRMGGVLVERNFELRPDLITIALPSYEGSAEIPSTVDVYADSIRRFTTDVPYGPFMLTDLPFSTGTTEAEFVVRDVTGRETRVSQPFFVSSDLMRPGLVDYSLAIGVPRLGIGTDTDRYAGGVHGVGSLRFGVTPALTVTAHTEVGENLRMAGLGGTFRVGMVGTVSASAAHSRSEIGTGAKGELSTKLAFGQLRLSARVMRSRGDFSDIARTTAAEPAPGSATPAPLTALNQISVTMPVLPERQDGGSIFYADTRRADDTHERSLGVSYSTQVFERGTLNLSAMATRGSTSNAMVGIGMQLPLGQNRSAGARLGSRNGQMRASLNLSGTPEDRDRGWHWNARADHDTRSELAASARLRHQHGRIELAARHSGTRQAAGLRAQGAVVVAGGGIFLSDRIEDAFAVVNAGAPGIAVQFENRPVGTTGRTGRLLVPGLRSYQRNVVAIDPAALPLDADVPQTREVVRPAQRSGVTLDFGIDPSPATALVELVDLAGDPLEVGLTAIHSGSAESFLVGYDGQVYLRGLQPQNELVVHFPDMSTCRAAFAYTREPGAISSIEGVVCE